MKRIAIIAGAVLVVLLAALAVIPHLVPENVYRERIESAASSALGRQVKVAGKISIGIFPRIEARAGNTTIANPAGFGDANFASMKELRASVKLIPLLFRKVEIEEFVLVEPNIAMVVLPDGRNNWSFPVGKTPDEAPKTEPTPTPEPSSSAPPSPGAKPKTFGASLNNVRIVNGRVSYDDRKAKQVQTLSEFNLKAQMKALDQPFKIEATGKANDLPFKFNTLINNPKELIGGALSPVEITLKTDIVETGLKGKLAMGGEPKFDFEFNGAILNAQALADRFKIGDFPGRRALGKVSLSGHAAGAPGDIALKIVDARHEGGMFNANFKGDVRFAEEITVTGTATADSPRLADLAAAMKIKAPAAAALNRATAKMEVSGKAGDLKFTKIAFRHEGDLKVTYDGDATLGKSVTYSGVVEVSTDNLRAVAAKAGTQLPAGNVYRHFRFRGATTGSVDDLYLDNATVEFDDIKGSGKALLTFAGRPKLTGDLTTNLIDISAYAMASGAPPPKEAPPETQPVAEPVGGNAPAAPAGPPAPWGTAPIDITPLRAVDADLTLHADGAKFQKFEFGKSEIKLTLKDGKMLADLKDSTLFGGPGNAKLTADATGAVAVVGLSGEFKQVPAAQLLTAAANFKMIDGKGDLEINVVGQGANLQDIMNSWSGEGDFNFNNGQLKGVNLTKLVDVSKENLLKVNTATQLFSSIGKTASTDFGALTAHYKVAKGVAVMNELKINTGTILFSGAGSLDIGKQRLGLNLFPEFRSKSQGINGYGLPIEVNGAWTGGLHVGLDTKWLQDKLVSSVVTPVINDALEKQRKRLGDDLADALGIKSRSPAQPPANNPPANAPANPPPGQPQPAPSPTASATPKSAEDKLKDQLKKGVGDLLKKN